MLKQTEKSVITPTAAAVSALSDNFQYHLASLFTPILSTCDLDSLILGLVTGDLDLGAGLLAEVVDRAATGTDNEPTSY